MSAIVMLLALSALAALSRYLHIRARRVEHMEWPELLVRMQRLIAPKPARKGGDARESSTCVGGFAAFRLMLAKIVIEVHRRVVNSLVS